MSEKKLERDEKGRFLKGHKESVGEAFASKWDDRYTDMVMPWIREQIASGILPTRYDFAVDVCGVTNDTLINWEKKYPQFRREMEKFDNKQLAIIIRGGADGTINPTFAAKLLNLLHGLTEKTETENTVTLNVKLDREIDEESD